MKITSRFFPILLTLFLGSWASNALAYDTNLYRKVAQLEKQSWSLSNNLAKSHLYRGRNAINDARNLAYAARSLKWAVKKSHSRAIIHRKFTTLKFRYNHLMRKLAFRDDRYSGYRERHIGSHIRQVQRSFHITYRAFNGRGYERYRYGEHFGRRVY